MPTPNGVNYLLQFLQFLLIPQLSETRIKSGRPVLCPYIFICPLAYLFLLNLVAKLRKLWHITKQFILNKMDLALYSLHFGRKCLILRM